MLSELQSAKKVVGVKQLRKTLLDGTAKAVFLAEDADPTLTDPIRALCLKKHVPVTEVPTMAELGKACGIGVGAAAAAVL